MEWIAGKCSTHILSQNPEDIETAVKLKICGRNKITLLGNGIDLNKFDPDRFDNEFKFKKRKEIGVPKEAIVIGIIGRLVREKGYLELFEAFKKIKKKRGNAWLVIIGPEEPEKTDRISGDTFKEFGIQDRTIWLGSRDDISELLACFDVYVLPSWREGFPRSAIEATSMRLPVVATNIRGCRQVVTDGKNGILVPCKSVRDLEESILRLIDQPMTREQMGTTGRQKALKEFDENRVCEVVLNTYSILL